ncbi:hypothetical protein K505DRAFT_268896 [Melanomma pulvis-pyrius CBS 109.77]|uniref:Arb2 domain-containing protein n=1 Tax=Melanomma pulvis-pyrius CBS 109.77 TaxID=1314802 RepID=A0A6A6XQC7_9PLEO|nr:hypothetical protein K505DRAFT_268896 [Melanomma pulvis-pyrius CBS 109.77]
MFRRVAEGLPPDASYPANLQKLGYFINEVGQIRMIDFPDKDFQFYLSNIDRHNEVHREAVQICQRQEVLNRLSALGIERLYLPSLSNTKPDDEPHVPILTPPANILKSRKRVVVLINDTLQDLGILAYRQLQRELGLNGGSVVNFTKELINRSIEAKDGVDVFKDGFVIEDKQKETPGLVVMNLGQLLYSHKTNESLSMRSWIAKPRKSICHDVIQVHEVENRVEGHRTEQEHIKSVFNKVLHNPDFVAADAEIYVIAIENGAENLLSVLGSELDKYGPRITAIATVHSMVDAIRITNPNLKAFLYQRARQWKVSDESDPRKCIEVPSDYAGQAEESGPSARGPAEPGPTPNWLETVSPSGPISAVSGLLRRLKLAVTPHKAGSEAGSESMSFTNHEFEPICLGFGGGDSTVGECVFTNTAVQHAILDFFEEVAQNPLDYRNPVFNLSFPQPTTDKPLTLTVPEPEDTEYAAFQPIQPAEMSPEQQEVDLHKQKLGNMKASLDATPRDKPELEKGRSGLERRIAKAEEELEKLQEKALATGEPKANEVEEVKENWETQRKGPMIPFAGTMVDSELVKGAGLLETAEEALRELDSVHED